MLDDMAWCRAPKPALPRVSPEIAKALIEEARSSGLRVCVHAPNFADAKEAIADGATALAHGVLEPIDEKMIQLMKQRSVFYIPTMDIFEFLADTSSFVDSVLADPIVQKGLPPDTILRYRSPDYAAGYRTRYPNFANVARRLPTLRNNLLALHAAGVPVALGTDMWAFPGLGVSIEMDSYVRSGISTLEAIRAGTQTAARSLAIDGDRGTLESGKRADFLLLSADPTRDVKNVRAIREIYKAGRLVGGSAAP
jgi:imidazolonepropionase-like amidohydrolase